MTSRSSTIRTVHAPSWRRSLRCSLSSADDGCTDPWRRRNSSSWCWCRHSCNSLGQPSPRLPDSHGPRNAEASIDSGYTRSTMWRTGFSGEQNTARTCLDFLRNRNTSILVLLRSSCSNWNRVWSEMDREFCIAKKYRDHRTYELLFTLSTLLKVPFYLALFSVSE